MILGTCIDKKTLKFKKFIPKENFLIFKLEISLFYLSMEKHLSWILD